jgi:hypothetical protein
MHTGSMRFLSLSIFRALGRAGLVAAVAVAVAPPTASAQARGEATPKARCADCPDFEWQARHERLLSRFDSLRREFEYERLTRQQRELISDEMHRTLMALQETMEPSIPMVSARGRAPRSPRGYLGISFDGPYVPIERSDEMVVRFLDYPMVALVEPGSPAEDAGIASGDMLLTLNGTDVRENEISLTKLLVPNRRISVRVRRDGAARDFRVTVAQAPQYILQRKTPVAPRAPVAAVTPEPVVPPVRVEVRGGDLPRRAPQAPSVEGAGSGTIWIYNEGIAGAHVETLTSGLARAVGVRSGVLVIRSRPGTPAYRAGLRDGDVILRAEGRAVGSVRELRDALVAGEDRGSVSLRIRREGRERDVTLRW